MTRLLTALCVATLAGMVAPVARAAEQTVLGKTFTVKDPQPAGDASLRSIVVLGKEPSTDDTVTGDPILNGATVEIVANGNIFTTQTFAIPGGASVSGSVGWNALGNPISGYSYKDALGVNGPVKAAVIKKGANGTFLVKVTIKGVLGPGPQPHIAVVPPAPGTDGGMRFTINAGDTYCVAFGGAAGGLVNNAPKGGEPDKVFSIASKPVVPLVEAGCPTPLTTTTTSSSSSTSTSTSTSTTVTFPPGCITISGRFCDLGNGTIFDAAGLQWEKKDGAYQGPPDASDPHNVNNLYSKAGCCGGVCLPPPPGGGGEPVNLCQPNAAAEAACKAQTPSEWWGRGCLQCEVGAGPCVANPNPDLWNSITTVWDWVSQLNAAQFGGHTDWRLPTVAECCGYPTGEPDELESIVDLLVLPPRIDPIFGPTASDYYWTSSFYGEAASMRIVSFRNGSSTDSTAASSVGLYVRAVR